MRFSPLPGTDRWRAAPCRSPRHSRPQPRNIPDQGHLRTSPDSSHFPCCCLAHLNRKLFFKPSQVYLCLFSFYTCCKEIHFHKVATNFWKNIRPHAYCMGVRFFKYLFSVDKKPGEKELECVEVLFVLHHQAVIIKSLKKRRKRFKEMNDEESSTLY